jgi:hypothetical protein
MVVKITVTGSIAPLQDLEAYINSIQKTGRTVAESVWDSIRDPLLDELRFYPPPPPNSRYRRTFRLRRGWKALMERTSDGYKIIVSNDTRYTQWVVGSLAQNRSQAARFQAAIHKGRWPIATDTVTFWLGAFDDEYEKAFNSELEGFAEQYNKRRAFTRVA